MFRSYRVTHPYDRIIREMHVDTYFQIGSKWHFFIYVPYIPKLQCRCARGLKLRSLSNVACVRFLSIYKNSFYQLFLFYIASKFNWKMLSLEYNNKEYL